MFRYQTRYERRTDYLCHTAKEASKRIVEDILTTAGMDYDDEEIDFSRELETQGFDDEATSPSVVRRAANIEDETF